MVINQIVGVYILPNYKDSLWKVGWVYPQYKELIDPGTYESLLKMIDLLFTSVFAQVNYRHGNIGRSCWCLQMVNGEELFNT